VLYFLAVLHPLWTFSSTSINPIFLYMFKVVTLILSDVIGDPLDIIASGPTVYDSSTPKDCLQIITKLGAEEKIPKSVVKYLTDTQNNTGQKQEDQVDFSHVKNVLVGTNRIAVDAAAKEANSLGYTPLVASTMIDGEAREVGVGFANLASMAVTGETAADVPPGGKELLNDNLVNELKSARTKLVCIIGAGETTVNLKGTGIGGRNQEMVLSCALTMHKSLKTLTDSYPSGDEAMVFLSAGTDGQDGPCPAAGAITGPGQVTEATTAGIDPQQAIDNNDSYTFYSKFKDGRDHIVTGLTGTNVMDIQVLLVDPKTTK
jgi:glycerate kinase